MKSRKSKNKNVDPRSFKLTRLEIERLYSISQKFEDTSLFSINQTDGGGIGTITEVKFNMFDDSDVKIDITDIESW
jgi:hypothetical protein